MSARRPPLFDDGMEHGSAWRSCLALSISSNALANTQSSNTWHAIFMALSFVWAVPVVYHLICDWRS